MRGVTTTVKRGDKWQLYTEDPSTLLFHIVGYAEEHGVRLVSLNTLRPSLEDVFLEITGQQVGSVYHASREKETQKRREQERV
jgi:ABC-2 type transport system ATP-binding protein